MVKTTLCQNGDSLTQFARSVPIISKIFFAVILRFGIIFYDRLAIISGYTYIDWVR